jgi:hypothetical protein
MLFLCMDEWSNYIKERDNFVCQSCGIDGRFTKNRKTSTKNI